MEHFAEETSMTVEELYGMFGFNHCRSFNDLIDISYLNKRENFYAFMSHLLLSEFKDERLTCDDYMTLARIFSKTSKLREIKFEKPIRQVTGKWDFLHNWIDD